MAVKNKFPVRLDRRSENKFPKYLQFVSFSVREEEFYPIITQLRGGFGQNREFAVKTNEQKWKQ